MPHNTQPSLFEQPSDAPSEPVDLHEVAAHIARHARPGAERLAYLTSSLREDEDPSHGYRADVYRPVFAVPTTRTVEASEIDGEAPKEDDAHYHSPHMEEVFERTKQRREVARNRLGTNQGDLVGRFWAQRNGTPHQ